MSSLFNTIKRLSTGLFAARRPAHDPERMSLHDWADLPAHHPSTDRAPR